MKRKVTMTVLREMSLNLINIRKAGAGLNTNFKFNTYEKKIFFIKI